MAAACLCCCLVAGAQEVLAPLSSRYVGGSVARATKGGATPLSLPFFEDFSNYAGRPSPLRWQQSGGALVDAAFATLPPTVGAMTLDALAANGRLYSSGSTEEVFPADTATSLPIRLDSMFLLSSRPLGEDDSVAFSFFYIPGGDSGRVWLRSGDAPEAGDSLVLEFYDAAAAQWVHAWSTPGVSVDSLVARTGSDWQYAYIPIRQRFLNKDFRFRFRNYCSFDNTVEAGMVGNCDQWHIDYIRLGYQRRIADYQERDVAFVNPAPSLLRYYTAMPAKQFRASDMAALCQLTITNRYTQTLYTKYRYYATYPDGTTLPGGLINAVEENVEPFYPDHTYQTAQQQASPAIGFCYPVTDQQRVYTVTHVITEGLDGDNHTQNDTIRLQQPLLNYYAYDDGSAENGYGVTSASSNTSIACMFPIRVLDTLTSVDIFFNRSRADENAAMGFYVTVWSNLDGHPGTVLYQDPELQFPQFDTTGAFVTYTLAEPLALNDTVFVGIQQTSEGIINMGFDRDNDASARIFYNIGGAWQNTYYKGALMLRPYFGARGTQSIHAAESVQTPCVYPNPATNRLTVSNMPSQASLLLFDVYGRVVASSPQAWLEVSGLRSGIYFLSIKAGGRLSAPQKVVVRR